jgi:SAM-dependent methyltransferase
VTDGSSGQNFGRTAYGLDAAAYDVGRPEYPQRVFDILAERCGLMSGSSVLEIGPGTGQATRRLVDLGARIVAVEPDPGMASFLRQSPLAHRIQLIETTFEEADLADDSFDMAAAATSIHWVDTAVALPKLMRCLRPGGWLAIWGTIFGQTGAEYPFGDAIRDLLGDAERKTALQLVDLQGIADAFEDAGFLDLVSERIEWSWTMTPHQLRRLYGTQKALLIRSEDDRARVLDAIEEMAATRFDGRVNRPFLTVVYTARRP